MPALPSKRGSRDLTVAALIPTSTRGVIERLGTLEEEEHALPWFLSDSGHWRWAGSLGKPSRTLPRAGHPALAR